MNNCPDFVKEVFEGSSVEEIKEMTKSQLYEELQLQGFNDDKFDVNIKVETTEKTFTLIFVFSEKEKEND